MVNVSALISSLGSSSSLFDVLLFLFFWCPMTKMYMCYSFMTVRRIYFVQMVATICMFIAGKVEETPRPLRDVIWLSYENRFKKDPAAVQRIKQKVLTLDSGVTSLYHRVAFSQKVALFVPQESGVTV